MKQEAYIIAMTRSAFARSRRGGFRFTRSDDLSVQLIQKLMDRLPGLDHARVDDVIVGCANPEGEQGLQIGRQIALRALGKQTPGMTVNRYCASGLESLAIATAKIRSGMGSCFVAGGVESMSVIPMEGYKFAPSFEVAREHPDYVIGMGLTAEAVAAKYSIARSDQDAFALRSHLQAALAQSSGRFAEEITPIEVKESHFDGQKRHLRKISVLCDEGIRKDTSLEALSALRPAFSRNGSVTAGNSSQTSDGACFHVVASESVVRDLGVTPIGRIVSCAIAGVEPLFMGIGPCAAIPRALDQAGLQLQDIAVVELNEAFAAQSLAVIREAGLDPEIVNPNGGAIALGHPLGCSGARLAMTCILELRHRNARYGLVTACVGGGQGIAAVVEAI